MNQHTRRQFLARTIGAGLGTAVAARVMPLSAALQAPGGPWKFAICNETFQGWPQDRAFAFAAACGYTGIEIAPFTLANNVEEIGPSKRAEIRRLAEKNSLQVVGLHWLLAKTEGCYLTSPDPEVRRKTAGYFGELARFCAELGGKAMVLGSPKQRDLLPGVTRAEAMKYAAETIRMALPALEAAKVVMALEPLSPSTTTFLTTAAQGVELAELVASPRCRLHLDCLAMSSEPTPIPELIHKYHSWLVHFHANDTNAQGPGFGTIDFVSVFKALGEVHYRGWISVEVFDYTPGPERLARESISHMKKCIAQPAK